MQNHRETCGVISGDTSLLTRIYIPPMKQHHRCMYSLRETTTLRYFFAVVGMDLLEGKLTRENVPENLAYHTNDYFGLNYDSLVNGLIVQFNLLVVNNWFIVADAACSVSNEGMRAFFILFYILGVLVALNVITAFILDTVMFVRAFPDREVSTCDCSLLHLDREQLGLFRLNI